MFSAIAPSYDINNRLHSMWMDQHWRNVAVKMAGVQANDRIVDVACGTGDLTIKFSKGGSGNISGRKPPGTGAAGDGDRFYRGDAADRGAEGGG